MKVLIFVDEIQKECGVAIERSVEKHFKIVPQKLYGTNEMILPNYAH